MFQLQEIFLLEYMKQKLEFLNSIGLANIGIEETIEKYGEYF